MDGNKRAENNENKKQGETNVSKKSTKKDASKLDQALAVAKAKVEEQGKEPINMTTETTQTTPVTTPEAPKAKRVKLTPEQRTERDEKRKAQVAANKIARAEKKAKRLAELTEKRSVKAALRAERKEALGARKSRIERAAEKLPVLDPSVAAKLDELTSSADPAQLDALYEHVRYRASVASLAKAQGLKGSFKVGDKVRVVSGPSRFIGGVGQVTKARKVRIFVQLEGREKPAYLYVSDCVGA